MNQEAICHDCGSKDAKQWGGDELLCSRCWIKRTEAINPAVKESKEEKASTRSEGSAASTAVGFMVFLLLAFGMIVAFVYKLSMSSASAGSPILGMLLVYGVPFVLLALIIIMACSG